MKLSVRPVGTFCVYQHLVWGKPIYVGSGTIQRAFAMDRRNQPWTEFVRSATDTNPGFEIEVEIIALYTDRQKAFDHEKRLINELKPTYNIVGITADIYLGPTPNQGKKTTVHCVETGLNFKSVTEAAKWVGVTGTQMSYHLNMRPGYRKVKGFTFKRGLFEMSHRLTPGKYP